LRIGAACGFAWGEKKVFSLNSKNQNSRNPDYAKPSCGRRWLLAGAIALEAAWFVLLSALAIVR
jgi:hypothetical protein